MRDVALATKLVILWTGISVYTSIPVKGHSPRLLQFYLEYLVSHTHTAIIS